MKILIISRRLNFSQSAPKCNLNLAIALSRLGHKVHVLTSYISNDIVRILTRQKVRLYIVNKRIASRYIAPFSYTVIAKNLKAKFNIDIILGNGYTLNDDITWVHFPRLAWIKIIKELHLYGSFSPLLLKLELDALLEKKIFSSSKLLWAVSGVVASDLLKLYGIPRNKIMVLYNGVDTEYYKPLLENKRIELKKRFNLRDKLVLLFVGSDPVIKGLYLLLNELKQVKNLSEIKLIIIGLKPSRDLLRYVYKLGLKPNVDIVGILEPSKLKLYYQLSDILVVPSLYDSFSLSTLEAMACGTVPVVSKYIGVSEIIKHKVNGFVIDPLRKGDLSYILDLIFTLSYVKLKSIRKQAINTAHKYSWLNIAKYLSNRIKYK